MSKVGGNRMKKEKTGGRTKGTPNVVTRDVRQAIATFAEGNVHKLQEWLDAVAKKDPAKAADLFVRVLEYHIPKLARSEVDVRPKTASQRLVELSTQELLAIVHRGRAREHHSAAPLALPDHRSAPGGIPQNPVPTAAQSTKGPLLRRAQVQADADGAGKGGASWPTASTVMLRIES